MAFAMAFAMIAAPAALAQNPQAKAECNQENCKQARPDCKKGDKKGDKKDAKKGPKQCGKDCKQKGNPAMKGITLSAEQQAKVDKINADLRAQKEKQMKDAKERQAKEMDKYNNEILKVLTPEQQAVYKQNVEKMKADRAAKAQRGAQKGQRKADRMVGNPAGRVTE